ncbi:hypothetical protein CQA53_01275 [Helicobacter didelphidarum]|uniref:Uncharacterized protein n=1 Tax=Helicobacter didelphidarum TaxID=2040648 RepID=A0A3D8IR33_9HELI|nr:hypothetical protein [Helicobacter didelphidarum]RDU67662.1 hypothetical protein CQA53_01275 [Helicobacter didelphidarum]
MKIIEIIFAIGILFYISSGAWLSYTFSLQNKTRSALTTLYALKHARILAMIDSSTLGHTDFGNIYSFARVDSKRLLSVYENFYWQVQFHTSGIYTKNALSIYRDTPRFANTTDFDRRPLAGDIVALHVSSSQCLSGYNNTNITGFCKDNALIDFRLNESSRLEILQLKQPTTCQERDTFRFYFNDYGQILCGQRLHTPIGLQGIIVGDFLIFIEPYTGYSFL